MSISLLSKDLQYQLLGQMDYDAILNLCQTNRQWYNFCRQLRIQKLIEIKYDEKINQGMDADDMFMWKVIEDMRNMDTEQQEEYLRQYSLEKLKRLYKTYSKWYNQLDDLLDNLKLNYPFKNDIFIEFISHLMSLGKKEVVKILEHPEITFPKRGGEKYYHRNEGFLEYALYEIFREYDYDPEPDIPDDF